MARKRSRQPSKTSGKAGRAYQSAPRIVKSASAQPSLPPAVDPPVAEVPITDLTIPEQAEAVHKQRQKQRWTNLAPNSKMRAKAAQICALKIQGKDNDEISKIVGLAPRSLRQYLWVAGKNGWLTSADPQDDVDYRLAHRAVSNLDELLNARDVRTGLPDKDITIQTLRGTGIFRNHDAKPAEGTQGQQNVLQINIQTPTERVSVIRPGTMQGVPAFIEGEQVE